MLRKCNLIFQKLNLLNFIKGGSMSFTSIGSVADEHTAGIISE